MILTISTAAMLLITPATLDKVLQTGIAANNLHFFGKYTAGLQAGKEEKEELVAPC